jgi:aspartate aminotransferase
VSCFKPLGAFYVFPNIKKLIKKLNIPDSTKFAEFLLDKAKIAVVPGEAFGAPGYIRLSYATSMENIKNGLDRLETAIK